MMGFNCYGFNGGVPEAVVAAHFNRGLSHTYNVEAFSHLAVTQASATSVSVAAGWASAEGVCVQSDAAATLAITATTSGTRWDGVYLRRDWSGTSTRSDNVSVGGAASLVVVQGAATYGHPAGRLKTPADKDDQPLALVQVGTAGITGIVDTRLFAGSGGSVAWDLMALPAPKLGDEVSTLSDGKRWRYTVVSGSPAWSKVGSTKAAYWRGKLPADRSIPNDRFVSFKPNDSPVSQGLTLSWSGDTFTMPAGTYTVDCNLAFGGDSGGTRRCLFIMKATNATTVYNSADYPSGWEQLRAANTPPTGGSTVWCNGSKVIQVAATDRLVLVAYQNSGGSLNLRSNANDTELTVTRIGD